MALAKVTVQARSGGRQSRANGAKVARTVCAVAVSPKGEAGTVIRISSQSQIRSRLDAAGKLADLADFVGASYAVPLEPSIAGDVGTVTKTGVGTATITPSPAPHKLIEFQITDAGALGTMKLRYRVGGVGAWSEKLTSVATSWAWRVPGTYVVVTFAAGTYVLNSTYTISLAGVITRGGSAIDTMTYEASPLDTYDFYIVVTKAGALGTAQIQVSCDGGNTYLAPMNLPSGGVVVVPNTGVVLTCSGTFVADEVYTFLAIDPGYSTNDLNTALTALRAELGAELALVEVGGMPSSAAGAISQAASIEAQMIDAFEDDGLDWQAFCDAPLALDADVGYPGDIVLSGGAPIYDTADTPTVLRAARDGQDMLRTAVCYGTHRAASTLTSMKLRRPTSWFYAARFSETDPAEDLSDRALGALDVYQIGPDASDFVELDEAQFNGIQAERDLGGGPFVAITDGGYGVKNLTTDSDWQDACGLRALNSGLRALRPVLATFKGSRPKTNSDGTIHEDVARAWDTLVDKAIKSGVGLASGDFSSPQASAATCKVLRTSQLGDSPHRADFEFTLQKLGFTAGVTAEGTYSGIITEIVPAA